MNKSIQNYTLLEKIGQGQYGNVYKAQHQNNKRLYAVKVMSVEKFKNIPKLTQLTNNEMQILAKIDHPNIIKFIEMLKTQQNFYLIYEFCNGGTLEDKIKINKMINQTEAVSYFKQLITAFSLLYEKKILHRDIKPTNILFHNGKVKLADFGFCKQLLKDKDMTKTMVGSPIYMSPQVLKGQHYDSKADIWSLGVVLYEMLYGHCPYEDSSIPKLITMINNTMLTFPKYPRVAEPLRVFIKRMLTIRVSERISPIQFIKYPMDIILAQKDQIPQIKMDYRGAIRFTRNNIMYLCQTLSLLANRVNDLSCLRMAFLVYKVVWNVWRLTKAKSIYWQQLNFQIKQHNWDLHYEEQIESLYNYGQVVRQAVRKCDNSLKIKLQLQKDNIDTRYFIDSLREIPDQKNEQLKSRIINCILINIHYIRVIDKKKPDWQDYSTLKKEFQQKEEYCLRYARYN